MNILKYMSTAAAVSLSVYGVSGTDVSASDTDTYERAISITVSRASLYTGSSLESFQSQMAASLQAASLQKGKGISLNLAATRARQAIPCLTALSRDVLNPLFKIPLAAMMVNSPDDIQNGIAYYVYPYVISPAWSKVCTKNVMGNIQTAMKFMNPKGEPSEKDLKNTALIAAYLLSQPDMSKDWLSQMPETDIPQIKALADKYPASKTAVFIQKMGFLFNDSNFLKDFNTLNTKDPDKFSKLYYRIHWYFLEAYKNKKDDYRSVFIALLNDPKFTASQILDPKNGRYKAGSLNGIR